MAGFFFKKKKDADIVANNFQCLRPKDIRVGLPVMDKYDAIRLAGRMLVERGSVEEPYVEAMIQRENTVSTYLGDGVAIPHGIGEAKKYIKSTGLVVLQFSGDGVDFGTGNVKLLVGIAGLHEEHIPILQAVAKIIMNQELLEELQQTSDPNFIHRILTTGGDNQ